MKSFGENLKALMERDGVSTVQLAKTIGEPTKTVQEWTGRGRTPRNLEAIARLAEFFKVSTHFILYGVEDPRSSIGFLFDKTEIHTGLYEITVKKVSTKKGEK